MAYPIFRLQAADVLAPEEMGSKRKGWVRVGDDTEPWLFKYSRVNEGLATGEAWAEKIGAEVAALIELPAARVEFASMDGAIGCISRQFPELSIEGVELVHGSDLGGPATSGPGWIACGKSIFPRLRVSSGPFRLK